MGAAAPFAPGVPLAVDDNAVATAGDAPVVIPVLANDVTGSLAPVLPVALLAAPTLGTASANADGTVTYTPSAVAGAATFQYTVSNAAGKSNVATVTVAVGPSLSPAPVAVNDPSAGTLSVSVPSAGTLSVSTGASLVIGVLANDSGNGGTLDPASIVVSSVTGGTAVATAAGTVTYTAGGVAGNFGFTYTVANTNGNRSNPATVAVTVLNPEVITLKGAQCQRQGTQWVVSGSSTVLSGTMTLFNVSPVPAAPTTAQVIANVPIAAGKWQYNVKGGPACVSPISLLSSGGGRLNGVAVTIK
jgi:hypothetical protein